MGIINTTNLVKFVKGTPTSFVNLTQKDKDTLYFICAPGAKSGKLYLGEILIAGDGTSLEEQISIALDNIKNNEVLAFDEETGNWVNKDIKDLLTDSIFGNLEEFKPSTEGNTLITEINNLINALAWKEIEED